MSGFSVLLIALGTPVWLADASPSGDTQTASSDAPSAALAPNLYGDEIIVTAQRVEQSVQDVGLTVSVLGAEEIRERRIHGLHDVARTTPNVDIENSIAGQNPVITIRGVGLNAADPANNSSVGVYVDEVFMSSLGLLSFTTFDLERIEVLKGPQGTLYGRNTTGGAINFLSRRPTKSNEGYLTLTAAEFETGEVEGGYGGALSERWSGRISGRVRSQGESYFGNRRTGSDFGDEQTWAGRGQLRYESDRLDLNLALHAAAHDGAPYPYKHFGLFDPDYVSGALAAGLLPAELGLGFAFGQVDPSEILCGPIQAGAIDRLNCVDAAGFQDTHPDPRSHDQVPTDGRIDWDITGFNTKLDYQLGGATLTSVTAWVTLDKTFTELNDANSFRMLTFEHGNEVEQFSQELRLRGSTDSVAWIAGVMASVDSVRVRTPIASDDYLLTRLLIEADQDTTAMAAFGDATWKLSDRVDLVTGLRATAEEIDYVGGTTDTNPFGTSLLLDGSPDPFRFSFIDDKIEETDVSGRLGLNFHTSEDWLFYLSASRGFKSGGFFADVTFADEELEPYDPETLWAYEAGWKADLGRGTLFSGALFYYDYEDVQTFVLTNLAFKLDNIDSAEVRGLDMEVIWAGVPGLDVRAGLGLLHTELGAFEGAGGLLPAGNRLPSAPEVSFNATVGYRTSVVTDHLLTFLVDYSYRDDMYRDAENIEVAATPAYQLVNGRVGWWFPNGWELALWGRNLADEDYIITGVLVDLLGSGSQVFNPPLTLGLSLTMNFE